MKKQSNSYLPNGGYTLTNGSNYMLDGFQYDTEYNGGVLEKARLPEAKGLASLPSGVLPEDTPKSSILPSHVDEEGGLHLDEFIKESSFQYIPIVDHSWLAQESKANLEGVRNKKDVYEQMENSFYEDSALKELSEMWDESTNGLGLVPNKNREYIKVVNPTNKPQAGLPGDDYREKIEKAMRRSAYGEPLKVILADLKQDLGNKYTDEVGNRIASDHGLHGKVYIREEAFKGLFNGTWDKQIKARCASAKYIIPASKDCVFDYHQGRKVVSNINWKSAFEHYAPKLKTIGVKLGSGSNYQARLKQAFLSTAPTQVQPQTWYSYQEDLTKKYSTEEAKSKFANYTPEEVNVESRQEREAKLLNDRLNKLAGQVLNSGIVGEAEKVNKILSSKLSNEKKMDLIIRYASQNVIGKTANYEGQKYSAKNNLKEHENDFSATEKEVASRLSKDKEVLKKASSNISNKQYDGQQWSENTKLKTAQNEFSEIEKEISNRLKKANEMPLMQREKEIVLITQKVENKISSLIGNRLITRTQVEELTSGVSNPQKKLAKIINYLNKPQQKDYDNPAYTQHILTNKKASVKMASAESVESWVRQKMAEGAVGNDLDVMLSTRFASEVLDHYADMINKIRTAHEGLSGQSYVDAGAYEKVGCEQGALQHRSNMIPAVLQMDKCATCVFKNAEGYCQKYNKPVIASVAELGIENPKRYQKESIRLANSSDSDRTASLFVNNYDEDEFGLTSNDEIEIDTNKTPSKLADVLFGGFEF